MPMSCAINCNEGTLAHDPEDLICLGVRPAGASQIVIYWCLDSISDITIPGQTTLAISRGEALKVTEISFGSDLPSPTLGPKTTACGTPGVLFNSRNITLTDYSYNQTNNDLYESLGNGRKAKAILAWDCNSNPNFSNTSRYYVPSSGSINFSGGLSSAATDEEAAFFQVSGTYKGSVTIIPTPAGLFV